VIAFLHSKGSSLPFPAPNPAAAAAPAPAEAIQRRLVSLVMGAPFAKSRSRRQRSCTRNPARWLPAYLRRSL